MNVDVNPSSMIQTDMENDKNNSVFCTIQKMETEKKAAVQPIQKGTENNQQNTEIQSVKSVITMSQSAATFPSNNPEIEEEEKDDDSKSTVEKKADSEIMRIRKIFGNFINNSHIQTIILLLITVNAVMMGLATFDFVSENPEVDKVFEDVDQVFLVVFTIEVFFQLVYHGHKFFKDAWLFFDFVIIIMSWLLQGVQIVRAFRIFRVLRLTTHLKTMRNLIEAIIKTIPRLLGVATLLILVMYIFSVMFTELFRDLDTEYPYFRRLDGALLTSFQMLTFDNWAEIAREAMDEKPWAWVPFVAFVIISGFTVINLVIAVICDSISDLHEEDLDKLYRNVFQDLWHVDETASESVTKEDCLAMRKLSMEKKMDQMDIQIKNLVSSNDATLQKLKELSLCVEMLSERKKTGIFGR